MTISQFVHLLIIGFLTYCQVLVLVVLLVNEGKCKCRIYQRNLFSIDGAFATRCSHVSVSKSYTLDCSFHIWRQRSQHTPYLLLQLKI